MVVHPSDSMSGMCLLFFCLLSHDGIGVIVVLYQTNASCARRDLLKFALFLPRVGNTNAFLLTENMIKPPISIYTPFSYTVTSKPPSTADLLGLDEATTNGSRHLQQQQLRESTPELFFFDYGVVVIWGMSEQEESRLLQEISRFEEEKLGKAISHVLFVFLLLSSSHLL